MERQAGILSGPAIIDALDKGDIEIDPFEPLNINPASIDLRLGEGLTLYDDWVYDSDHPSEFTRPLDRVLDVKDPLRTTSYTFNEKDGLILVPGILYLMHTVERVRTEKYVPILDGKSSIGRLGIQVHITAGYGDPGFDGQYTLEVTAMHHVRVYPGMRFCQMRFHTLAGPVLSYQKTGHYRGEAARGAVPSRVHEQFNEDLPRGS